MTLYTGMIGNTFWVWGKGDKGSVPDNHVAFVHFGQEDGSEVDGPDSVVGFFKVDVVFFHGVGNKEQLVFQPEGAGVGDPLDKEVPGVFEGRQALGKRARRGAVAGARGVTAQCVVRALVVVYRPKAIECSLLGAQVSAGGGRQAPALSVLCMRSWAPFSCGEAG